MRARLRPRAGELCARHHGPWRGACCKVDASARASSAVRCSRRSTGCDATQLARAASARWCGPAPIRSPASPRRRRRRPPSRRCRAALRLALWRGRPCRKATSFAPYNGRARACRRAGTLFAIECNASELDQGGLGGPPYARPETLTYVDTGCGHLRRLAAAMGGSRASPFMWRAAPALQWDRMAEVVFRASR